MEEANLYEQERRGKLQRLRELGIDPYGQRTAGIAPLAQIRALHKPEFGQDGGPSVKGAGRVVLKRDMGKLSFLTLRDESGDLQVAIDRRRVDDRSWEVRGLLDLGDQIVAEGALGTTKTGEVTVWATNIDMAAKALLPPPAKWEGLSDVELRYRQRYVDLWANPEVMRLARLRTQIVSEIRRYLIERGYVEVETPMMQALAGGAAARPFETHHNALDIPLYLRIAPELYLKRLLVGGFSKVFELNRNFRNEGISPRHNPEFTMLEAYEAFGSWETMADLVEGLIGHLAEDVINKDKPEAERLIIRHANGRTINLTRPWRRVRMADLVEERTGWKFDKRPLQESNPAALDRIIRHRFAREMTPFVHEIARDLATEAQSELENLQALAKENPELASAVGNFVDAAQAFEDAARERANEPITPEHLPEIAEAYIKFLSQMSPAEQLVEVYEKLIEPTLIDPTFVTHVPSVIIPLARENKADPFFADVYELAINGQEISPGYTELNDPDTQAKHFHHQVGDEAEKQKVDEDFLTALKYGMPPAGGLGLGIDRLIIMLTGAESIRDVILFPLMKPQGGEARDA